MSRSSSSRAAARRVVWALLAALLARAAAAVPEPPGAALRCRHRLCEYVGGSSNEHEYQIEGKNIIIRHSAGSYLEMKCNKFSVLDSPALPRALSELGVTHVTLSGCPPPAARSLADALGALNVKLIFSQPGASNKPLGNLVLNELPHAPPLAERHFRGLEGLLTLRLSTKVTNGTVRPERGFLRPLRNLEMLIMQQVTLPPDELDQPPPRLRALHLQYTDVEQLPGALLNSTNLRTLTVGSTSALNATAVPPGLLVLDLQSPATSLQLDAAPSLSSLMVMKWVEERPASLTRCGNLTKLHLTSPAVRELPNDWLANCSRLQMLVVQYAKNLTSLPPRLLTNASALTLLSFNQCALETLPAGLLDNAPRLRELYLFGNHLRMLPSGLFAVARDVRILNLSSNELTGAELAALAPLRNLTSLNLAYNPHIRDLCNTQYDTSPMRESTNLKELILRKTNVSQICSDWRRDMTELTNLDLRSTNVSELWFVDLQFVRTVNNAKVKLEGAPVAVVAMTREQYNTSLRERTSVSVQINNLKNLTCDCRMYWTRRALAAPNKPLSHVAGMRCAGGRALEAMRPEEMLCADDEYEQGCAAAELPPQCECGWRPDENPAVSRVRVRVDCAGRGLARAPRLRAAPDRARRLYELLLAHNHITALDAHVLRPDVIRLDLRNNSLEKVNAETVTKLSSFGGMLRLADNPVDCSCSAAPLLRVLSGRANFTDLNHATCRGGVVALSTAPQVDCLPLLTWIACVIAVLLTFAVAAIVFLSSRKRRFFIKVVLHRWGCLWYSAESEEDDGRRYDAFVTFSHKDEQVVLELVARLEPPYRLCVHYRDWVPGRYITEQVVESVQDSRRTIALVSQHFLKSGWALAEFRQAHAAAMLEAKPRLVVVLLEDPSTLELDEQLSRYLNTNTYVRWGDPWFWDKLALALPRPRPVVVTPAPNGPRHPPSTRTSAALPTRTTAAPRRPPAAAHAPVPAPTRTAGAPRTAHSSPASVASCATSPAPPMPVASSAQTRPSVKQPASDTQVTISTDASEFSPVIKSRSTSTKELVLTPPRQASTYTSQAQDVTPTARDVTPTAQDVTSTARDVTPEARDKRIQTTQRPVKSTLHRPAVAVLT